MTSYGTNCLADAREIRSCLIEDGWLSPDTYGRCFSEIVEGPAVYLFLLYQAENFKEALVAYVGMSTALSSRIASHNILPVLRKPGYWPMRWFKPTPLESLRQTEQKYITQFNPPWNIAGRQRGVMLP